MSPFVGWFVDRFNDPRKIMGFVTLGSGIYITASMTLLYFGFPPIPAITGMAFIVTTTRLLHETSTSVLNKFLSDAIGRTEKKSGKKDFLTERIKRNGLFFMLGRNGGSFLAGVVANSRSPFLMLASSAAAFGASWFNGHLIPHGYGSDREKIAGNLSTKTSAVLSLKNKFASVRREMKEGFSHIVHHKSSLLAAINLTAMSLGISLTMANMLIYSTKTLNMSSSLYSLMFVLAIPPSLAATHALNKIKQLQKLGKVSLMTLGGLLQASSWACMAAFPNKFALLASYALFMGPGQFFANSGIQSVIQSKADNSIQGRVVTAARYPGNMLSIGASLAGGILAQKYGPQITFTVAAGLVASCFGISGAFLGFTNKTHEQACQRRKTALPEGTTNTQTAALHAPTDLRQAVPAPASATTASAAFAQQPAGRRLSSLQGPSALLAAHMAASHSASPRAESSRSI